MFKVSIINKTTNQVTNQAQFETEQECLAWVAQEEKNKSFGKPEHTIQVLVSEEIPATYDEEGNELTPTIEAVYEDQVIPADYEVVIEDKTEELSRQQELAEKLANGENIKIRCERAIALILDHNSAFSFEQIDQLEEEFGEIYNCLMRRRIDKAYMLISQVQPTELISQEFLDSLKQVLVE